MIDLTFHYLKKKGGGGGSSIRIKSVSEPKKQDNTLSVAFKKRGIQTSELKMFLKSKKQHNTLSVAFKWASNLEFDI